jgi:hypothetical protein
MLIIGTPVMLTLGPTIICAVWSFATWKWLYYNYMLYRLDCSAIVLN